MCNVVFKNLHLISHLNLERMEGDFECAYIKDDFECGMRFVF